MSYHNCEYRDRYVMECDHEGTSKCPRCGRHLCHEHKDKHEEGCIHGGLTLQDLIPGARMVNIADARHFKVLERRDIEELREIERTFNPEEEDLDPCDHGIPGGCEVTCRNCGHTCRRHHGKNYCDHEGTVRGVCGCDEFEGTEG